MKIAMTVTRPFFKIKTSIHKQKNLSIHEVKIRSKNYFCQNGKTQKYMTRNIHMRVPLKHSPFKYQTYRYYLKES